MVAGHRVHIHMHLSTVSAVSIGFCVSSVAVQRPLPELNPVIDTAATPSKMVDIIMHARFLQIHPRSADQPASILMRTVL